MDQDSPPENVQPKRNDFGKQNGGPYPTRFYGRGSHQQGDFPHQNYQFHPHHPPPYRSRGHPRGAPWIRSRFTSPHQGNGDNFSPRMFYGGRGGHSRGHPRDNHHGMQPYNTYRGSRRPKPNHSHMYQSNPNPNYFNHSYQPVSQPIEEYVPYSYGEHLQMFPQHDQYLHRNNCMMSPQNQSPGNAYYHPALTEYSPKNDNNDQDDNGTNTSVIPYCPENFQMAITGREETSSSDNMPVNGDNSVSSDGGANTKVSCRRPSTDSSDDSSSLRFTSDSSDDFDNDDAASVSTFDTSEGEEKTYNSSSPVVDPTKSNDEMADSIGEISGIIYPPNGEDFMSVYILVKSSIIIDGRGNSTPGELACFGVWFDINDERNLVEEVSSKYNQDRGKTGYILGVIKALEIIKEQDLNKRIHFTMGSSFIMNNLSSWVKNLKCENPCSTNWTEWKHFSEINQLLSVLDDGLKMTFSLAHPRDKCYIFCKESVASYWNEVKMRRLLVSPPLSDAES